jgi:hypothetical protein
MQMPGHGLLVRPASPRTNVNIQPRFNHPNIVQTPQPSLKCSFEFVDIDPRCVVVCGTRNIGQRDKEQPLIWIGFLLIETKEYCYLLAKRSAPAKSREIIDTSAIPSFFETKESSRVQNRSEKNRIVVF